MPPAEGNQTNEAKYSNATYEADVDDPEDFVVALIFALLLCDLLGLHDCHRVRLRQAISIALIRVVH